jgi:Xaa-Pro aminopeptidase
MGKAGRNILLISESETNSNMLYASGFKAPDPFIFFTLKRKSYLIASPLEYERAKKESKAKQVINSHTIKTQKKNRTLAHVFLAFLKTCSRNKTFEVPYDFPVTYADLLRSKGIRLKVTSPPFFPERMIKNKDEIKSIKKSIRAAEKAMKTAEQILKHSKINSKGYVTFNKKVLTSEFLKSSIQVALAQENTMSHDVIAAAGDQACDPHCSGFGRIRAGQLIIIDIFPKSIDTGYFGDITRTFIKGSPSKDQKKLYATVKQAQEKAISLIRPGAAMETVHKAVSEHFTKKGYETVMQGDTLRGFIHSTGHGFGLDIHEPLRVGGKSSARFKKGMVVTVEPGLYYPGLGGVRIEDDVVVTSKGCELLSHYHKRYIVK